MVHLVNNVNLLTLQNVAPSLPSCTTILARANNSSLLTDGCTNPIPWLLLAQESTTRQRGLWRTKTLQITDIKTEPFRNV